MWILLSAALLVAASPLELLGVRCPAFAKGLRSTDDLTLDGVQAVVRRQAQPYPDDLDIRGPLAWRVVRFDLASCDWIGLWSLPEKPRQAETIAIGHSRQLLTNAERDWAARNAVGATPLPFASPANPEDAFALALLDYLSPPLSDSDEPGVVRALASREHRLGGHLQPAHKGRPVAQRASIALHECLRGEPARLCPWAVVTPSTDMSLIGEAGALRSTASGNAAWRSMRRAPTRRASSPNSRSRRASELAFSWSVTDDCSNFAIAATNTKHGS